ncbi:MAG: TOBE domain-containing protein [Desulfobacterales bacterium]
MPPRDPNPSPSPRPPAAARPCLTSRQLDRLGEAFDAWVRAARRADIARSRRRVRLIYLLIRHTGARLREVLELDPGRDVDPGRGRVRFRKSGGKRGRAREVRIPGELAAEAEALAAEAGRPAGGRLALDPAHVRRKFYERAREIGLPRAMAAPEAVRRSRALELLRENVPLPVVQRILGQASPARAASYVRFSEADLQRAEAFYLERARRRTTSARNAFFGKVAAIRRGDVQAEVGIALPSGERLRAVITRESLKRLGLRVGGWVAAEVKAPWLSLHAGEEAAKSSADNVFAGRVVRLRRGALTAEVVTRSEGGVELCAVITRESATRLGLRRGQRVQVGFSAFAVVLHEA